MACATAVARRSAHRKEGPLAGLRDGVDPDATVGNWQEPMVSGIQVASRFSRALSSLPHLIAHALCNRSTGAPQLPNSSFRFWCPPIGVDSVRNGQVYDQAHGHHACANLPPHFTFVHQSLKQSSPFSSRLWSKLPANIQMAPTIATSSMKLEDVKGRILKRLMEGASQETVREELQTDGISVT